MVERSANLFAPALAVLLFGSACSSSGEPALAGSVETGGARAGPSGGGGGQSAGGQNAGANAGVSGGSAASGSGGSGTIRDGGGSGSGGAGEAGTAVSGSGGTSSSGGSARTLDGGNDGSAGSSGSTGWVDRCADYPSFPDENCTGPTTSNLSPYTGSLDFRTDNQVVENVEMRIDRGLYVPADNVTFRNVKIVFTGALDSDFTAVNLNYNAGTVFEDCEIDGQGNVARAITGSGVTVRNCEIHDVGNAVEADGPLLIEGNYFHDIYEPAGTDWHADGIQTPISTGNVTIIHNTVFGRDPSTSAINVMGTLSAPATDVLIEHNLLAGGGYTLYAGPGSNYRVIDNHLSTRFFPKVGYYNIWYWDPSQDGDVTRSGNVIHETGADANTNL
jgi:hypothetical protein